MKTFTLLAILGTAIVLCAAQDEIEEQKPTTWANASYVMTIMQDTTSKSNYWSAQANLGTLPNDLVNEIKNNMNTYFKTTLPLKLHVGTVDGNRVGVLNVSMEKVDGKMMETLLSTPEELILPSGAQINGQSVKDIDVHSLHNSAKWIAYHIQCMNGKIVANGKTSKSDECMTYSEEFVSTALPAYKFFAQLVCGESPITAWKNECEYWSESKEKSELYGSKCIDDASNALKEGSMSYTKDNMDIVVTDSDVSTKIRIVEGDTPDLPHQVDTTSTTKRETKSSTKTPDGRDLIIKVYSQNIYDSLLTFTDVTKMNKEDIVDFLNIC